MTVLRRTVRGLIPRRTNVACCSDKLFGSIHATAEMLCVAAERADEKTHRRSTVRMGIRVVQRCLPSVAVTPGSSAPSVEQLAGPPPHAAVEKPFLLSDGRVELEASLDKAVYSHGEPILVNTAVHNNSGKTVRRIKVSEWHWRQSVRYQLNKDTPHMFIKPVF